MKVLNEFIDTNNSSIKVSDETEVLVKLEGVIDVNKAIQRIEKSIEKETIELERVEKKLKDDTFVSKAPEKIIERESLKKI